MKCKYLHEAVRLIRYCNHHKGGNIINSEGIYLKDGCIESLWSTQQSRQKRSLKTGYISSALASLDLTPTHHHHHHLQWVCCLTPATPRPGRGQSGFGAQKEKFKVLLSCLGACRSVRSTEALSEKASLQWEPVCNGNNSVGALKEGPAARRDSS